MALVVKNLPANAGDVKDKGLILGWEDPLEKGMANHSSILAWRIPWTEEAGGPPGGCQESDMPKWLEHAHTYPSGWQSWTPTILPPDSRGYCFLGV